MHPREITAAWCSRFVPLPNLEQVVAGAVGAGPPELGYNQTFLYPKAGGIETFTRALRRGWPAGRRTVHTRTDPDAVDWRRREVVGRRRAHPATGRWWRRFRCPSCCERMPDAARRRSRSAAARLRCTTLRYLNIAARRQPRADWHWIYVPETAVSVLPRERLLDGGGQHGPRGLLVDLRGDGRSRARSPSDDRARHDRTRWWRPGALRRRRDVHVRRAEADRVRLRGVRSALLRGDARRSSHFSRRRPSTRAAATARGPTTPWRTACSPAVRWRR